MPKNLGKKSGAIFMRCGRGYTACVKVVARFVEEVNPLC